MFEKALDKSELLSSLERLELTTTEIVGVMQRIESRTLGLVLYGSRARHDYLPSSDFDILRYTDSWNTPTFKIGRVSVSSYTREQLESASTTLFGTHVRRDGKVLVELDKNLTDIINALETADPDQLLNRVKIYSKILSQPHAEKALHYSGMVRLARYLLRTSIYALAMKGGDTCFSVRQLSQRFDDPQLATLLASDPEITGSPSVDLLNELVSRLEVIIGPLPVHGYQSLEALAIAYWDDDRNLAALAIRASLDDNIENGEIDYSDLPKVLL
ncbi:nucleotidyltransferase domain-containing protein [Nocardia sp. NPDC055049]